MGEDENVTYTAGLAGFIVFFVLAIALWLLVRNMNVRLRRMRYYAEQEDAAEEAATAASAGARGGDQAGDPAAEHVVGLRRDDGSALGAAPPRTGSGPPGEGDPGPSRG